MTSTVGRGLAALRRRRYAVYVVGLVVVLASRVGPAESRTPLTVAALTAMCATYLAELHGRADAVRAETAVVGVAVAGIATGVFLLVEVNRIGGVLFVLGGFLFFRAAVRPAGDPS